MNTITLSPTAEKTTRSLAIISEVASRVISLIQRIIGIAMEALGSCLFFISGRSLAVINRGDKKAARCASEAHGVPNDASSEGVRKPYQSEAVRVSGVNSKTIGPRARIDMAKPQQADCHLFIAPVNIPNATQKLAGKPPESSLKKQPSAAQPITSQDPLALTFSDKLLTANNVVQWSLIGAIYYGMAPTLIMPLSVLSSLGSEVAAFCTLPKDASWLRRAMSIPMLSKIIINYNPWVARIFQATSLYNLVEYSASKLKNVWNALQSNPSGAIKSGAVHLFNLASGTLFAAESAGLIRLKTPKDQTRKTCPIKEPKCPGLPPHPSTYRKITVGTIYEDNGRIDVKEIADLVDETHKEYAERWNLKHEPIVSKGTLANQCTHPKTKESADCSAYWAKIPRLINWLNEPAESGKEEWLMLIDHDGPITNMAIDPHKMVDQLRNGISGDLNDPASVGNNASVILAQDANTNLKDWFPQEKVDQKIALNTGFWLIRKDDAAKDFINRVWETRNIPWNPDSPTCPSLGLCKTQEILHEQRGAVIVLKDHPELLDKAVTVVPQRDPYSPTRAHIALNTSNQQGCFLHEGSIHPFRYRNDLPSGIWQPGDFMGQPNGVPGRGKALPILWNGACKDDPNVEITSVKKDRVIDMIKQTCRNGLPEKNLSSNS